MTKHPPIPGRRTLEGDLLDIRDDLLRMIVKLDRLGEADTASLLVEAVETLVKAPLAADQPTLTIEHMADDQDHYQASVAKEQTQ